MQESSLKSMNLLYVEDESIIRNELIEILQDDLCTLYTAQNGKEGLELYKKNPIDIIITDIRMPEMDGLAMSRAILEINPSIPIIISSAFNDTAFLMDAIKMGIHYYLLKPINLQELFTTLEQISNNVLLEKRMQKNEQLLAQYKEAVDKNSIVSKTDKTGMITYVNDAFCEISGYSKEELLGQSHNIIRHPETKLELFKELWDTILSKKPWKGTIKNRAKNGSFYIVDSTILPVLDSHNEIIEFISIRHDITQKELDKEQLENKLHTRSQTLNETIQFIYEYENALRQNTLFCRTSVEGNITMASHAFLELFKLESSKAERLPYIELVENSYLNKFDKEIRYAIDQHQEWKGLVKHKDMKGKELYLESSYFPIMDTHGTIHEVLCFYIDITEQVYLNREIITTQKEVISTMGAIGETRSKETGDHVKRVAEYSKLIALKYGLSLKEAEEIKMASPMHDIGKVGIPDNILNKPGKLTSQEFEIMKTHAVLGHEMLKASKQPLLKTAAIISLQHHEKWDGSGYPRGLKGKDIHLYGRITAIADVFDALGHDRVYKKAWPLDKILDLFKEGKGKHFDPELIDILMDNLDDFLAIKERFDGKHEAFYETL